MQQAIPGSPDDRPMDAKYRQLLHAEPGLFTMLSYVALGSSTSNSATSEPFHLSYKPVTPILRDASTLAEVSLAKDHIHLYICLKHSLAKNLSPDSPFSIKPIRPSRTSEILDLQSQIHTSRWESLGLSHLSSYLRPVHLSAAGFPRKFHHFLGWIAFCS